jgi:hypothetical protein
MRAISKDTCDCIVKRYFEMRSITKVSVEFGIAPITVSSILKRRNITLFGPGRRFVPDDDFFSTDTPEAFYWAGFIAADGCIIDRSGYMKSLSIALSEKDLGHLEAFKRQISFGGKTFSYNTKVGDTIRSIQVYSDKMCDDLGRFNVVPRKTHIYKMPRDIEEHPLASHFIRGYNDGDGCFYMADKGASRAQLTISIRGTMEMLSQIRRVFHVYCGTRAEQDIGFSSGFWQLRYSGNIQAKTIGSYLYKDTNNDIMLGRKYNIFKAA